MLISLSFLVKLYGDTSTIALLFFLHNMVATIYHGMVQTVLM
jgi:hypothetical protein